ncbi:olfactory receptor 1-like [Spea bombifrons]|uniref:olfactory receptor 1-like n=1 Tax=Spea bombifrons TaxID=233779 RepID=UPI00234A8EC8|nr:olfactory receptor 1-like [Spea bombifrons]
MFLCIYLIGLLGNLIIIVVVSMDSRLHTPMYFFLCNLSAVDICYTTVTLPKLMDILATGNNSISFEQCFIQMYFYNFIGSSEIILLSVMAYDRYVAICNPLKYHLIMNRKKIVMIWVLIWVSGCGNSLFCTSFASNLSFCQSNRIQNFYCDIKAIAKISCADTSFHIVIYIECLLFGLLPFLLSITSYVKIIISILHIKSKESRRKAFSTCTSHLTVLVMFYGTILCMYMGPTSGSSDKLDQIFSVLYTALTPMLNPLVYSLRNKEVKSALSRLGQVKSLIEHL